EHVAEQAVGEARVEIRPERAFRHSAFHLADPGLLELAQGLPQISESWMAAEITPVVLQHRERGPVLGQCLARGADDLLEHESGIATGCDRGSVIGQDLAEETGEYLVADRLLGVEVVVQAARQYPGRVGDLSDGCGAVTLLREQLTGEPDHVVSP